MIVQEIPLLQTVESPWQHRRTWGDIDGLAEDIGRRGVLQPILVRPHPTAADTYELIFGHRRRRASEKAGRETVPALVREATDAEVREIILVENDQREDVHPLDQADLIRAMLEDDGLAVEDVVAKVGRSRSWVYGRLKYADLGAAAREAFLDGRLDPSRAELLARVPAGELQERAFAHARGEDRPAWAVDEDDPEDGLPTVRQLRDWIHHELMQDLKGAPFDPGDPQLVPEAGACSRCPKRTGAQPELFGDVASADVCTDPPCFQRKAHAHADREIAQARADGKDVLDAEASAACFPQGDEWFNSREYVQAGTRCMDDPKARTYNRLLGRKHPYVYARSPSGKLVKLVRKKGLQEALREAGVEPPARAANAAGGGSRSASGRLAPRPTVKSIVADRMGYAVLAAVGARAQERGEALEVTLARAEALESTRELLLSIVPALLSTAEEVDEIEKRYEVPAPVGQFDQRMAAVVEHLSERGLGPLVGVLVESALSTDAWHWNPKSDLGRAAATFGVDLAAIEYQLMEAVAAERKAEDEAAKAKKKTSKKKARKKKASSKGSKSAGEAKS